ncbi:MAG: two pore domain potassium channel family protein [Deltaproteobacteria bacterium]|nr:MAG: two pore domain potassium channel family protein [Deltaproteobacteria bacterium]
MEALKFRLRIFLVVLLVVVVLGIFGLMIVEDLSLADALYFTIVTIATVGYGDIHPATLAGKILAVVLIITGVGTFMGVVANAIEIMLNRREKKARIEKLNMVTSLFFSEIGNRLLTYFVGLDPQIASLRKELVVTNEWSAADFLKVNQLLKSHTYNIDLEKVPQEELKTFFDGKVDLLLRLLENPALMERESFTETIRAVFHFRDELLLRQDISQLPESDKKHLSGDMKRAYRLLAHQWLDYMKHLKDNYPYMFSLAMRTNPFDLTASPIVNTVGSSVERPRQA